MKTKVTQKDGCFEVWVLCDDQWIIVARYYFGTGYALEQEQAWCWSSALGLQFESIEL